MSKVPLLPLLGLGTLVSESIEISTNVSDDEGAVEVRSTKAPSQTKVHSQSIDVTEDQSQREAQLLKTLAPQVFGDGRNWSSLAWAMASPNP